MDVSEKAINWLMDRADKIGGFIDELAKQLGVAASHVYEVLVKQQYVDGIGLLVKSGIWIIVMIIAWVVLTKLVFKKWDRYYEDVQVALGLLTTAVLVGTVVMTFILIGDVTLGIKKLLNPEYYALEDLMQFIQGQMGDKK